jgi:hypothetical protein
MKRLSSCERRPALAAALKMIPKRHPPAARGRQTEAALFQPSVWFAGTPLAVGLVSGVINPWSRARSSSALTLDGAHDPTS